MRARPAQEENVVGQAGTGGQEEWCAACAVADVNRGTLKKEVTKDGDRGGCGCEMLGKS